ncbi:MAG TPA: enoyl-CoA hydratase [Syntrophales bacterium]|nr:enoyl-CoA hydratase [Syntrophales bacterium]HPQ43123.1 enoyl-CoA hydratase [Syntrophales bacterium]
MANITGITNQLIVEKQGSVGIIKFNNPTRLNAMTFEMWRDLGVVLEHLKDDDEIRVVVLTGEGNEAFCAGADISEFEKNRSPEKGLNLYNDTVDNSSDILRKFPKPTIAKIKGHCIGGGVALAICCDIRICADNAIFAIPAAKLSLGYRIAGLKPFVDLVGPSFAKEVFFTARKFTAGEARDMGMINRVVPASELNAYVADYTRRIAENAPLTIHAVKIIVAESVKDDSTRDLDLCTRVTDDCFKSEDYKEGYRAFMEKRKPLFKGR